MDKRELDPSGGGIALWLAVAVGACLLLGASRALLGNFESARVMVVGAFVASLLVTWLTKT